MGRGFLKIEKMIDTITKMQTKLQHNVSLYPFFCRYKNLHSTKYCSKQFHLFKRLSKSVLASGPFTSKSPQTSLPALFISAAMLINLARGDHCNGGSHSLYTINNTDTSQAKSNPIHVIIHLEQFPNINPKFDAFLQHHP